MNRERDGASITNMFSDNIVYCPKHATYFGLYKSILRHKNMIKNNPFLKSTIIINF